MAFTTEDWFKRPDWNYAQNGAISIFRRDDILEKSIRDLKKVGYLVSELDCSTLERFYVSVSRAYRWSMQFGYDEWSGGLDALNDSIRTPPADRFLVVARGFQRIANLDKEFAHDFWDILEYNSRNVLLTGQLMLGFVQVQNGSFKIQKVGARNAIWNKAEWLHKDRGI